MKPTTLTVARSRLALSACAAATIALAACGDPGTWMGLPDEGGGSTTAPNEVDTLVLDPETLSFFGLPINSLRMAVAGHDPDARVCATIIWDYSNNGMSFGPHCDDFFPGFPYVVLETDTDGPCGAWDYGTDVQTVSASGCVDFAMLSPFGVDLADVEVVVASDAFTGSIRVDSHAAAVPAPVSFGISYTTDIPESVWVQSGDDLGLPGWVDVRDDDDLPVWLFDRCDIPICDEGGGACGQALPQVLDVTQGGYGGQVFVTWDGHRRALVASGDCLERVPAPPGDYVARFCFGWSVTEPGPGGEVLDPWCEEVPFTLPGAEKVVLQADFGG